MLPRHLRLSRSRGMLTGKEMRATSPHFSVSVRRDSSGSAVIVSKKTEPTSVGRHTLKRRVLSILSHISNPNVSIVVHARKGSSKLPYHAIQTELTPLLTSLLQTKGVR